MSIGKRLNLGYTGGAPDIPLIAGDRYYGQDFIRDFRYLEEITGLALFDFHADGATGLPFLAKGGFVTQGTGDTLNITAVWAYVNQSVKIPNTFAANPPSVSTVTQIKRVYAPAQTNLAIAGATLDGVTVNYVKLAVAEADGNTRTRKKKAGTYAYEITPSYTITVTSAVPNSDTEIELARFTGSAGGTFVITNKPLRDRIINRLRQQANLDENPLINSNFDVWQRGTSFTSATTPANSDDTYLADQWILLSDGNNIAEMSRSTDVPNGSKYSAKFVVSTANKRFGIIQILESGIAKAMVGKTYTMSFQAKTTSAKVIKNIDASLIYWTSTADSPTSDVVNNWAVPNLNLNWSSVGGFTITPLTQDWRLIIGDESSAIPTTANNVAIFIHVDDTDCAIGDELFITQIKLTEGKMPTPYAPRNTLKEIMDCQRYFQKSYNTDVNPGAITTVGCRTGRPSIANVACADCNFPLPTRMFKTPTIVWYSPSTGTAARIYDAGGAADRTVNSNNYEGETATGYPTLAVAVNVDAIFQAHFTAEAVL